jgi:ribonucleoside-diphosphate reductase alpha subunit
MKVIKRNGESAEVRFDQITDRLKYLSSSSEFGKTLDIDAALIAQKVCSSIYNGISTSELDEYTASVSANLSLQNLDYENLAARVSINNHQKNTSLYFSDVINKLKNCKGGSLISDEIYNYVIDNLEVVDKIIKPERDYLISYFGFKTLHKGYLLKINNNPVERPQHMYLRVAFGIHGCDLENVINTYNSLSLKYYTHATPTLFNAGTNYPQMSSCFLIGTEDSVPGIYKTISDVALISKWAGGVGVHISNIRAKDSYISKTGGKSDGIMPMLKVYNDTARYINQSGKRNGSFAMYIEPWHADIFTFLDAKKNNGAEELRARDLFYALWIPDLFMKRVKNDEVWSLMCPNECPKLNNLYGDDFEELYLKYEADGKYRKQIKAIDLFNSIINSQIETGTPYILYKDASNIKSNQKNLGVIKSSNLCCEIIQYSDEKETAVCNLASLCLPKYIQNGEFNFELLGEKVGELVLNLNKIIDRNHYPTPESSLSNMKHRPIGIGVQGLADLFMILNIPFTSHEAQKLNKDIFETIYYYALKKSCDIAKKEGKYDTFENSPMSKGILQFDMWGVNPEKYSKEEWDLLKNDIITFGTRNSLLVAPMPTASTAQIMGNNESIEPYTTNIYTRRVLAGEFIVINKYLVEALKNENLFNKETIDNIIYHRGSVKYTKLSDHAKEVFKTAWEISQKTLIKMSAHRGAYICQSQSLNLFIEKADPKIIASAHLYSWSQGLKTGSYYIRTKPAVNSQSFTLDPSIEKKLKEEAESRECLMCSG